MFNSVSISPASPRADYRGGGSDWHC